MTLQHPQDEDQPVIHAWNWRRVLLLTGFAVLAVYSVAGYFAAGSLQGPGYRTAAWIYLGLLVVSCAGIVVVLVWRGRRADVSRPVI
jgi:hypothetical protein